MGAISKDAVGEKTAELDLNAPEIKPWLLRILPYLETKGWLKSAATKSAIDAKGRPLPWYCYSAIHFLAGRVEPSLRVFEYGCGNSTLWWARRAAHVTACEHTLGWYEKIRSEVPDNVRLMHRDLPPAGDYPDAVNDGDERYDVIVIDGRERVNCATHSVERLTERGVVIWDNSNRERYKPGLDMLVERGFRRIDFFGHGPIVGYETQTTIFYRPDNCLGI